MKELEGVLIAIRFSTRGTILFDN